jgi:hypothetical protein
MEEKEAFQKIKGSLDFEQFGEKIQYPTKRPDKNRTISIQIVDKFLDQAEKNGIPM